MNKRGLSLVATGNVSFIIIIFIFFSYTYLILSGCNANTDKEEQATKSQQEKQEEFKIDSIKHVFSEITKLNDVKFLWDTLSFPFTLYYEYLLDSGNQLIDNYEVLDIFRKDDKCHIFLCVNYQGLFSKKFYFDLTTTGSILIQFLNAINHSAKPTLLVKISTLEKMALRIIRDNQEYTSFPITEEHTIIVGKGFDFIGNGILIRLFNIKEKEVEVFEEKWDQERIDDLFNISIEEAITELHQ